MEKEVSTERMSDEYIELNSCGINNIFNIDCGSLRKNGRIDYHILYVSEGLCTVTLNGENVTVSKGGIILYRPYERQEYLYSAKAKSVSYYIHFTGTGCAHILNNLKIYDITTAYIGKNIEFEEIFKKMLDEYSIKPYAYKEYCSSLLLQLLTIISRTLKMSNNSIGTVDETRIANSCREIHKNLNTITIEKLCQTCGLSVGRFSHIFKKVTGMAPHEYICHMRINRAKELLVNTDLPIGLISKELGYSEQNYFSRIFKKMTGISPTDYRKL